MLKVFYLATWNPGLQEPSDQSVSCLLLFYTSEAFVPFCLSLCSDKSEDDVERESQLLECRLTLTEERNAVLVPSAGSGIPGAPAERCVSSCFTLRTSALSLSLLGLADLKGLGFSEAKCNQRPLTGLRSSTPNRSLVLTRSCIVPQEDFIIFRPWSDVEPSLKQAAEAGVQTVVGLLSSAEA